MHSFEVSMGMKALIELHGDLLVLRVIYLPFLYISFRDYINVVRSFPFYLVACC